MWRHEWRSSSTRRKDWEKRGMATSTSPTNRKKKSRAAAPKSAKIKPGARAAAVPPRARARNQEPEVPSTVPEQPGLEGEATGKTRRPSGAARKRSETKAGRTTRRSAPSKDGATRERKAKDETPAPGKLRSLVIVESPTKSRTLTKFLGRGFTVMASNGHIMDLPKSKLGVDLERDFEPEYVPIRGKAQALTKIKTAARTADRIFLAPDPDREGEAIAWHLAAALKSARRPLHRLTFNEITERAVKQALDHPRDLDMNLVNAQQARRVLDRLVGYKVSPFVWRTVRYGLSAGRVQSVALRLICEREEAIKAFVPEEYWTLEVDYETREGQRFTARLVREGEVELEQGQIRGEGAGARAWALAAELAQASAMVVEVETAPRQVHPKAPFITSTLQQTAFNRVGDSSQRTMKLAQQLYEGVNLGDQGSVGL